MSQNKNDEKDKVVIRVFKIIFWFVVIMAVASSFNKINNKLDDMQKKLGEIQAIIEHSK
jgi:hypothetical protein